ncbi:MAG: ABC transporter permease [Desulfomonile tiedjei]|nr:ABC transporter permease [Desulfomonile tiedjei]
MFHDLFSYRDMIRQFAWREVVGRYKGTYLGLFWSLLNPLLTLAVYTVVFGVILKARFGPAAEAGTGQFALALFCGIIIYNVFSVCASKAPSAIYENPSLVKKVVFPLEILPVAILLASIVNAGFGLAILIPTLLILSPEISSTIYMFPLVLLPLCALSLGVAWFLASLGVFVRDVGQAIVILLQLLFFASPVIYPLSAAPGMFRALLRLNPLTTILEDARRTLIWGQPIEWGWWFAVTIVSLVLMQLGYVWFMKSKRVFADII